MAAIGDTQKMTAVGLSLIPQLFMLPSPDLNGSGDLYPLNMPSWTLLFELFANIVFVLIWRRLSTPVLVAITALAAVVLAICTFTYGTLDQGPSWWNFWGGFARAMFGFFCGVLIYRVAGRPQKPSQKRIVVGDPGLTGAPMGLAFMPQTAQTKPFIELAIVVGIGCPAGVVGTEHAAAALDRGRVRKARRDLLRRLHDPLSAVRVHEAGELEVPAAFARVGAVDGHRADGCDAGARLDRRAVLRPPWSPRCQWVVRVAGEAPAPKTTMVPAE